MSRPENGRALTILLADDDEEDRELARDALQDAHLANEMKFAVDGQDLLDYLRREGRWADPSLDAPRPGIILTPSATSSWSPWPTGSRPRCGPGTRSRASAATNSPCCWTT